MPFAQTNNHRFVIALAAFFAASISHSGVRMLGADCCPHHQSGGGHDHGAALAPGGVHDHGATPVAAPAGHQHGPSEAPKIVANPPHGGQVHATPFQFVEVVYLPQQTRVYVYGADQRPRSVEGVRGQVAMRVRGSEEVHRYPLQHVAAEEADGGADYLAVAVNVSRVRDGDVAVAMLLEGLPDPQERRVTFTQTFALSRVRPSVTVGTAGASDATEIARQGTCPVMGAKLGSMGPPVKLLVGDQPLYVCCTGCVEKVRQDPEAFLARAAQRREGS